MRKLTNLKLFLIEHWYPQGRTDRDLAQKMGVDASLVNRWVNGVAEPSFQRKIQIAGILHIDSRLIFPEKGKDEK